MKTFKIDKKKLFPVLYRLSRVTKGKVIDDVLKNFNIEVTDSVMEITASNAELSVKEELEVVSNFEDKLNFVVDAEKLTSFIKNVDGEVKIKVNKEISQLKVEHSGGTLSIPCREGFVYRKFSYPGDDLESVSINGGIVYTMLKNVKDAADGDVDTLRQEFRNVFLDIKKDRMCVVSADGPELRLATYPFHFDKEVSAMMPFSFVDIFMTYIKNSEDVKIKISDKRLFVIMDGVIINCVLPEGRYPNYERIVNACADSGMSCYFDIQSSDFLKHIERVDVCSGSILNITVNEKESIMSSDPFIDTMKVEENLNTFAKKGEMNNNFTVDRLKSITKLFGGIMRVKKHGEMKCIYAEDLNDGIHFKYILMSLQVL